MIVGLLVIGYAFQYNPYFLSEYLWKVYWTGSGVRTAFSLSFLLTSLLLFSYGKMKLRQGAATIILAFLATGIYGFVLGGLLNKEFQHIVADSIFWFETAAYIFLLGGISYESLLRLLRSILVYSILSGLVSVAVFWSMRDQVAVAALIGGERVVRLADLQAPLMLILLYFKPLNFSKTVVAFGTLVFTLIIFLGFFRSVWAALILAVLFKYFINPRLFFQRKVMLVISFSLAFIIIFEWMYFHLTGVNSVVSGRVIAGIGTADSLGRVSTAMRVLEQFSENLLNVLFGYGFGAMAHFVNDFGDGEIGALQPVGSLSNYYVGLVFQLGLIWCSLLLSVLFLAVKKFWRSSIIEVRDILLIFFSYVGFQWLTFPSAIHFPIAMTFGIAIALFGCPALPGKTTTIGVN